MSGQQSPPKKWRRIGWIVLGFLAVLAIGAVWVYREAMAVPDFYAAALSKPSPVPPKAAADKMERDVLTVQNALERAEPWQLVLREDEINAWLASELAIKAPNALPKELKDPRVVISSGTVHLACKHESLGGVLSLALVPSLTGKPNQLAVRVQSFSLGRIPLPQKQYLNQVKEAVAKAGVALTWREEDGFAVAEIILPSQFEKLHDRTVTVKSLDVREGELVISGTAERSE